MWRYDQKTGELIEGPYPCRKFPSGIPSLSLQRRDQTSTLQPHDAPAIVQYIENNKNVITTVDLDDNSLKDEGIQLILNALKDCPNLTLINLSKNNITDVSAALNHFINKNVLINLSSNPLNSSFFHDFIRCLRQNPQYLACIKLGPSYNFKNFDMARMRDALGDNWEKFFPHPSPKDNLGSFYCAVACFVAGTLSPIYYIPFFISRACEFIAAKYGKPIAALALVVTIPLSIAAAILTPFYVAFKGYQTDTVSEALWMPRAFVENRRPNNNNTILSPQNDTTPLLAANASSVGATPASDAPAVLRTHSGDSKESEKDSGFRRPLAAKNCSVGRMPATILSGHSTMPVESIASGSATAPTSPSLFNPHKI